MDDVEDLGSEEEESDSDKSSEGSDSGDSSDPSAEEEVDPELRRKIEEALRVNGIEPATGETESEEEELMDDDQMMAIDEQLAQVFRARANEKKGKSQISYVFCQTSLLTLISRRRCPTRSYTFQKPSP